jgi:hypothetical protein
MARRSASRQAGAATEEDIVRCCGTDCHEIVVGAGAWSLAMQRCALCGFSVWSRDGVPLARDEAYTVLATAYQHGPAQARAHRDAAAERSAARKAQRTAATPVTRARPEPQQVVDLLAGWKVLGALS